MSGKSRKSLIGVALMVSYELYSGGVLQQSTFLAKACHSNQNQIRRVKIGKCVVQYVVFGSTLGSDY